MSIKTFDDYWSKQEAGIKDLIQRQISNKEIERIILSLCELNCRQGWHWHSGEIIRRAEEKYDEL